MVLLAYYNGWSREQLAAKFDKPVNTIKTWLAAQPDRDPGVPRVMTIDRTRTCWRPNTCSARSIRDERAQAQALIAIDPAFAAMVRGWERRLGELHAMVDAGRAARPRCGSASRRVEGVGAERGDAAAASRPGGAARRRGQRRRAGERRVGRWRRRRRRPGRHRRRAVGGRGDRGRTIPSSCPGRCGRSADRGDQGHREGGRPGRFVAVLQPDAASPAFILTVDVASRTADGASRAGGPPPGKSYELWLVSDRFPAPRSLGLVGSDEFARPAALASYDPATISNATYAVSLEPEGGSPNGQPTEVLFASKLIELTRPRRRTPDSPAHTQKNARAWGWGEGARNGDLGMGIFAWAWGLAWGLLVLGDLGVLLLGVTRTWGYYLGATQTWGTEISADQRIVDVSVRVMAVGLPAFMAGPAVWIRAAVSAVDAVRAAIPTTMIAIEATSEITTIFRWVVRSAVKIVELFMTATLQGPLLSS